ncbi:MAG TPA: hypothetical protein DEB39_16895 [Planctomycetaceae bacterium]|nr:hypothetical protein [Planctomycetaceae bacterium]
MSPQLTCAVTEAPETSSDTDVLKCLESTLAAAKRAGRNHTFIYDPTILDPVPQLLDAPDFGLEEQTIDLDS